MYRGRFHSDDEFLCVTAQAAPEISQPQNPADDAAKPAGAAAGASKRIACIMAADFQVAAIARANPVLRERAFALTRMPSARRTDDAASRRGRNSAEYQPHSELSHVSQLARAAGVRPGMTVAQARALIPDLVVTHPSPAAERAAADALADVAESMSPIVEERAPGCVWVDLTGVERLYRHSMGADETSDEVEDSIAAELVRRARRIGLEAAAGIASRKEIAYLAARCGGARVILPGREREFLDWMPLDLLDLGVNQRGDDLELMLKRLGIRRLGDVARLDIRAVGSRLGSTGVELARLARGEGSAAVIARPRVEAFAEATELEYGIENLEPLNFVLRAMLKQLAERLELRGLIAGDMTLSLGLADHRHDDRRVAVAAPTLEVRSLLTLLDLSLEASPPPAAVETIRLVVEPRPRRPAQSDMFLPPSPAPDRLEAAIARIAALCGPDRVGTLMPADSHRPEAVKVGAFAPPPAKPNSEIVTAASVARMVMRTMRPAEEVEVMCRRETPEFVRGMNICARVVSAAGPWRRQGEWWAAASSEGFQPDPKKGDVREGAHQSGNGSDGWDAAAPAAYARDYYELALADGAVYRVYCDLYSGKWFVDGMYD